MRWEHLDNFYHCHLRENPARAALTRHIVDNAEPKVEALSDEKGIVTLVFPKPVDGVRGWTLAGAKQWVKDSFESSIPNRGKDNQAMGYRENIAVHERISDAPEAELFGTGLRGLAAFTADVLRASQPGGVMTARLAEVHARQARTTPATAGADAGGGFLLPEGLAAPIIPVLETNPIRAGATKFVLAGGEGDSLGVPKVVDTTHAAMATFGGITSNWVGEGKVKTESEATVDLLRLRFKCLCVYSILTNQLVQFAKGNVLSFYENMMAQSASWTETDSHLNGTGANQPLGLMNSGARINHPRTTVTRFKAADASGMFRRMWAPGRSRAIWIMSADVIDDLIQLSVIVGTAGGPVLLTDWKNGMPATLLGRPIYFSEHCQALGTAGDVMLADPSQYAILDYSAGPQVAISIHLKFDYNLQCLRFEIFTDGGCLWDSVLTPHRGTYTTSPVVVLSDPA